jgi:hypothetical protein
MLNEQPLIDFLNSKWRNCWIDLDFDDGPKYEVYFRKSMRPFGSKVLDLANANRVDITVENVTEKPEGQRPPKGKWGEIVAMTERLGREHGFTHIYAECVGNDFLPEWYERHGFTRIYEGEGNPSFYKGLIADGRCTKNESEARP